MFRESSVVLPDSGLKIAFREYPSRTASQQQTILALHGWQDNCGSFYNLAPLLAQYGRVLALDLPGHGHSDWLGSGAQYHFVDWLVPLRLLLERWHLDHVALIGHSMGAGIGMLYATCFPDQVTYLGMIEAFSPLPHRVEDFTDKVLKHCLARKKLLGRPPRTYSSLQEAVLVRMAAGLGDEAGARAITERGTILGNAGWHWRNDPRIKLPSLLGFTLEHVTHCLHKLRVPRDLILAEAGESLVARAAELLAEPLSHTPQHMLPGGHHCHLESPELVAKIFSPGLTSHK